MVGVRTAKVTKVVAAQISEAYKAAAIHYSIGILETMNIKL